MKFVLNVSALLPLILVFYHANCVLEHPGRHRATVKDLGDGEDESEVAPRIRPSKVAPDDSDEEIEFPNARLVSKRLVKLPISSAKRTRNKPEKSVPHKTSDAEEGFQHCSPRTTTVKSCNSDEMETQTVLSTVVKTVRNIFTVTSTVTVPDQCDCPRTICRDISARRTSPKWTTPLTEDTDEPDEPEIQPTKPAVRPQFRESCQRSSHTIQNSQTLTRASVRDAFTFSLEVKKKFWTKTYDRRDPSEKDEDPFRSREYSEFKGIATDSSTTRLNSETMVVQTWYRTQPLGGNTFLALTKEETRVHRC